MTCIVVVWLLACDTSYTRHLTAGKSSVLPSSIAFPNGMDGTKLQAGNGGNLVLLLIPPEMSVIQFQQHAGAIPNN